MKRKIGLSFKEIKELYPHQYVGLSDIVYCPNSRAIVSATVKYTLDDISYEEMCSKAIIEKEIFMLYTTADEDCPMGGYQSSVRVMQNGEWIDVDDAI